MSLETKGKRGIMSTYVNFYPHRVVTPWVWLNRKGLYECRALSPYTGASPLYGVLLWQGAKQWRDPDSVFRSIELPNDKPLLKK